MRIRHTVSCMVSGYQDRGLDGQRKMMCVADKKEEYIDNADRVEVERPFSLAKRCYGLGRIMTKLDVTTKSSVALSILVVNVAQ